MQQNRGKVPLERALSKLGAASRAQTREWVLTGRLKVNGRKITDPHFPVTPETDRFTVDGRPVGKEAWITILLNKPGSVVTTRADEKGRRTVFDLLPPEFQKLHAVGRLDMATTGLLLMTNDTRLSAWLTDPANAIARVYSVTVKGCVTPEELARVSAGIMDEGELLKPAVVTLRKASGRETHLMVELTEGKNREIRRLFAAVGHEVSALKRISFGNFKLEDLQPGEYRRLSAEEVRRVRPPR